MINAVNDFLDDLRGGRMAEAPVVKVEQGQLQGKVVNSPSGKAYFAFQGIPYAKPPLGSLRFKAPQPHEPWEGIRDATSEGNVSAQIDPIFAKSFVGDENCLFLNVYTPNIDGAFLPVMVYVHGGGLVYGSGNTDLYGPDYLVEKDVVVVTINYRLGALGFLSLNTAEVPGNAGMKDVVLALRWVKENIHNFGGNSGNLTIFGESAGGGVVSMLTASPLSKNLISRAIIQSGSALLNWFHQDNPIENARKLAQRLGCEAESIDEILEFLSATPVKDIVESQVDPNPDNSVIKRPNDFVMVVEKEFPGVEAITTEPFADLLKSGRVAQVPIMIGTTTLEFAFEKTSDDFQFFIPNELQIEKGSETALAIAEDIKKLYIKGGEKSDLEYYQLVSDVFMNVDTHRYVQYLLHSTNVPVYFYKFDYVGELNISNKYVFGIKVKEPMHLDDLGYIFKNDFQKDTEPTPQDLKVRERMVRLWTNFAKTGNPTPDENHYINVTWRPAAKDIEHYLHIAQELTLGTNYDKEKMDFWDGLYEKYYRVWNQPESTPVEVPKTEPVIVETLTVVTSSNEENSTEKVEIVSHLVEITNEVVEKPSELVEIVSEATKTENEVVDAPTFTEAVPKVEEIEKTNNVVEKPQLNGNSHERSVKRTSNEIKMVQNSNGVPKDVIRANDPPEDDLPKNIGVNKFVNFFESLGGKK